MRKCLALAGFLLIIDALPLIWFARRIDHRFLRWPSIRPVSAWSGSSRVAVKLFRSPVGDNLLLCIEHHSWTEIYGCDLENKMCGPTSAGSVLFILGTTWVTKTYPFDPEITATITPSGDSGVISFMSRYSGIVRVVVPRSNLIALEPAK